MMNYYLLIIAKQEAASCKFVQLSFCYLMSHDCCCFVGIKNQSWWVHELFVKGIIQYLQIYRDLVRNNSLSIFSNLIFTMSTKLSIDLIPYQSICANFFIKL